MELESGDLRAPLLLFDEFDEFDDAHNNISECVKSSNIMEGLDFKILTLEQHKTQRFLAEDVSSYLSEKEFVDVPKDNKSIFLPLESRSGELIFTISNRNLIMTDLCCEGKFKVLLHVVMGKKRFPLFLAEKDDDGAIIVRSLTKDNTSPMYGFTNDPFIAKITKREKTMKYDFTMKKGHLNTGNFDLLMTLDFVKVNDTANQYSTQVFNRVMEAKSNI